MHKKGTAAPAWPYWILALYTLTALVWLAGSESLLLHWTQDPAQIARWKDWQGYVSILLNALMGGWLLQRLLRSEAVRRAALERRALRRRAENARQRLAATVVDNTIEGVVVTDANSVILSVNAAFTRVLGYTEQEMLGQTPRMFKSGRHGQDFYDAMWDSMRRTGHWQGEIWNRRKNGEVFPERMSLSAVYDSTDRITHYVCMFTDITAEKAQQKRLEYLARKDPLTGLDNRAWFVERLEEALAASTAESRKLAVLLININRLRDFNDSYGHAVGDQVLCHVATRVQAALRPGDLIGRMTGDEIAVAARDLGNEVDAAQLAQRLIAAAAEPWHLPDGMEMRASVSIGMSLYPHHAATAEALLQGAHSAVYVAKQHSGADAWCFFQEDMTQAARERLELEARLRQALGEGHLQLYYQPQVDIATGRLTGAEALLRWLDPVEGLISPARFIPIAESSGVIGPMGEWVIRETCAQGRRWRDLGLPEITLAVNVSLHQFLLTDIVGCTQAALADADFPAALFELEITESALAQQPEEALQVLRRLSSLGLRLAIDDFGTGYSSLAHLKRFPIDVLKIDQGFIRDIPQSADDMAISAAVIAMGHSMGLTVLAEGVETAAQLDFLRARGCDHFQGYFCSRPLPADAFEQLLRDSRDRPLVALAPAGSDAA
ncbi:putative bifunctional diguanylate cyclase/phosphodiesterase [Comamonas antarctica]|uniref:EAL domain-containing protein n=1 Tax=Comamonas antarctica TaxID=2743470 RepID=A0A6N1X1P8_9BURK|nr:EAL domain-containing protein [Comamonas antarctica]QKV51665.1 EAL domain-containing protein [Comamonas antarctica]